MNFINQTKNQITLLCGKIRGYKRKLMISFSVVLGMLSAYPVFATNPTNSGGNAITQSTLFVGLMKLLQDASVALLVIAPIAGGVLITIFSLMISFNSEQHEKEKWSKNRKMVIITLIIVFSVSGIVSLISSYFNGGQQA